MPSPRPALNTMVDFANSAGERLVFRVHANNSHRGTPIRVAFFDNRIEVENPGLRLTRVNQFLDPGFIERTLPDKLNSRPQKYRLTAKAQYLISPGP